MPPPETCVAAAAPPPPAPSGRDTPTVVAPCAPWTDNGTPDPAPASPFQLMGEIGRGGMSVVHLARDPKLGRFVAIKRLGPDFLAETSMRERFSREARLIASLNHIYIVKIYDFETQGSDPRIVMEYVAGPGKAPAPDWPPPSLNLEQKLEQDGRPLTVRASVQLIRKLCAAMDYAHRRGVIHRDLKPSNILLDEHGEPRIVDFGIARGARTESARLTMTGTRILSLGYAAPEQETDPATADERADVYSLGGILYFCLTGENPRFFRDSRIPDYLRPILLKALEQRPADRWPTARDFADVLAQSAGDFLSPLTEPGMWRCKWCNAANPVTNRYCSGCNWDGMERCPECNGETRVGVRFCGQCATDVKAFEDMRALLDRLREYRRQKDFTRTRDALDGVAHFQPRGGRGEALKRELLELGDTAAWALRRKDELTQAIAQELERQNYDGVRERLNEYSVLDDGPEYRELRDEIPWRIAERNIVALRAELNQARQLLTDRQPAECRRRLGTIEDRLLSVSHLESRYPALKGTLTLPDAAAAGAAPGAYAKALAALGQEAGTLRADVTAAMRNVERVEQAAFLALTQQDYEGCLRAGDALRALTVEPSPVDEALKKAAADIEQINRLLKRANAAISEGSLTRAEGLANDVLRRFKEDSAAARHLLHRIRRLRRRRAAVRWGLALLAGAVGYALSIGPAFDAASHRGASAPISRESLRILYRPVFWLHRHTPLKGALETCAAPWDETLFREDGAADR